MQQDQLWLLLAHYLSGEATATELQQLQQITNEDAELKVLLDTLHIFWQGDHNNNIEELKTAWQKHLRKLD